MISVGRVLVEAPAILEATELLKELEESNCPSQSVPE
jgi:hypothetical protein